MADPARAKSLFLAASEIADRDAREAFLDRECGEDKELRGRVEALLRADAAGTGDDATVTQASNATAQTVDYADPTARVGSVLAGKYKLVQELGEGGMGSVFVAQQTTPVKRTVAVKVIKAGMDSRAVLARFEAERQALAMMDHPNIARVLDAGTTGGGRPFFVMELVKGTPITQFCDERKLTPRQRLELFVPVCQAIQHAHQKGIIHRDIKPSNVLVAMYDDRPVPKVIDFGVAKAAGQSLTEMTLVTAFGGIIGTPEYMSPEQANLNNLDIDTRSDVYSLGVLLYELLTGTTPVDRKSMAKAQLLEVLRIVREVEAPRPSAKLSTIDALPSVAANRSIEPAKLARLMAGELDWVLLRALEKDRKRRYESANGLARDIQRYLADEVVEARPPSAGYRLKKFIHRNKGKVLAVGLLLLILVAGIVGTTLGLFEARKQTGFAQGETDKKNKALVAENERGAELKYQLGISNILLANAAYNNDDVRLADQRLDLVPAEQRGWEWRYLKQQSRGGLFTMLTSSAVSGVAYSPDGTRIATVGGDQGKHAELKVWDARTGKLILDLKGHPEISGGNIQQQTVSFSPDGTRIITGGGNTGVRLWDARTGALILNLDGFKESNVLGVAQSPEGSRIAVSDNFSLQVRDAATGKIQLELESEGFMYGVAFSPDGNHIVGCSDDGMKVFDARTGKVLLRLTGRERGGQCVAYSPDGARIIVGNEQGVANVLDARTGAVQFKLKARTSADRVMVIPPQGMMSVSFSPDCTRILTCGGLIGHAGEARVWDAKTGAELLDLKGHTDIVLGASFSPDGAQIVTGSADTTIKVWDVRTGTERLDLERQKNGVNCVVFSPDGTQIVTGASDGRSDVDAGFTVGRGGEHGPRSAAGVATLWDARTGAPKLELIGPPGRVNCLAFSADGTRIVVAGADLDPRARGKSGHATVWDAKTGKSLFELKGLKEGVYGVALSRDGTRIVTTGSRGNGGSASEVKLWDAQSGSMVLDMTAAAPAAGVSMDGKGLSVAFSPDGMRILLGGGKRLDAGEFEATVVDAKTGSTVFKIMGHQRAVLCVAYNADGSRIITTDADNLAKIWDGATGEFQIGLKGHVGPVNCAAFNRDGTRIVTGSADRSVRVWDARTGTSLVELKGHIGGVNGVSFSPDGQRIVSGGGGGLSPGEVIVWEALDQDDLEYRKRVTQPNILRYREGYVAARAAPDEFAATFYFKLIPVELRKASLAQADAHAVTAMSKLADERFWSDPEAALPLRLEILRIQKANLAADDPALLEAMSNLGQLYSKLRQYDKAIPLLEEVWKARKTTLPLENPTMLNSVVLMGVAYKEAGRFADAILLFEQSSAETHPILKPHLLEAYALEGKHDKVIALLLKQLPEARKLSPEQAYTLTDMLTQLGAAYLAQRNGAQAEVYFRECQTVLQKLSGPGIPNWRLHYVDSMLGAALLSQQKYADAEPLLIGGYEGVKENRKYMRMEAPQLIDRIPDAIEGLIELYTATNKPDEVEKWQAERANYTKGAAK